MVGGPAFYSRDVESGFGCVIVPIVAPLFCPSVPQSAVVYCGDLPALRRRGGVGVGMAVRPGEKTGRVLMSSAYWPGLPVRFSARIDKGGGNASADG